MMRPRADTTILLTYTTGTDPAYEAWLRSTDNPFFNAIPGVSRYENWKIVHADRALEWTHFDFMDLLAANDLERVWFNPDLDAFRKGWIAKWGYGAKGPAPMNRFGYRMERVGTAVPRGRCCVLRGAQAEPPARPGRETWRVTHAVHKHYASGPVADWLIPVERHPGPGFRWLSVEFGFDPDAPPTDGDPGVVATLVAGPPW